MRGVQCEYSRNIGRHFGYIFKKYMGVKVKKEDLPSKIKWEKSKATDFLKW